MIALLFVSVLLHAESVHSPESWLKQSIDQRTKNFSGLKDKGFAFLSKTAFSEKESLQTRWRAVTTMGRVDAVRFHSQIERALRSPEWFLRNAALIALLSGERSSAVEWSLRLLHDRALVVRTQAVRNLIALNAREAESALWSALYEKRNYKGSESLWIRGHIAEALATFAGPGRAKAFERMLLDQDSRLHKWAVNGLEASTGVRMSDRSDPVEIRRQQWLSRLGAGEI